MGIKKPPLTFVRAVVLSSGRQDSNLRSPGPKPGALTGLGHAPIVNAGANIRYLFHYDALFGKKKIIFLRL